MHEIVIFYIPVPDKKTAKEIATKLLEKNLIACANIIDGESIFFFNKGLQNNPETLLLIKTAKENINPVIEFIEIMHPYEIPLIAHYIINVNEKYYNWLKKQLLQ